MWKAYDSQPRLTKAYDSQCRATKAHEIQRNTVSQEARDAVGGSRRVATRLEQYVFSMFDSRAPATPFRHPQVPYAHFLFLISYFSIFFSFHPRCMYHCTHFLFFNLLSLSCIYIKLVYVLNNKSPMGSMNPMGFRKPMTHARENPCPQLRAWVLTGTGAGCMGKPQGSPSYSLMSMPLLNLAQLCQPSRYLLGQDKPLSDLGKR